MARAARAPPALLVAALAAALVLQAASFNFPALRHLSSEPTGALPGAPPTATDLPPPAKAVTTYTLSVPPRLQYDANGGFCGEVSIQQLALRFGAWVPQAVARGAGGGELLLGVNYGAALTALRLKYENFGGAGYSAFITWAKARLVKGVGVVSVAFVKGLTDPDYDHIMPIVGWETATGPAGGYDGTDVVVLNTGYDIASVRRTVSGYSCSRSTATYTINQAGCVPKATTWGTALTGPAYANATGPATALAFTTPAAEPGLGKPGVVFNATLTTTGLVAGLKYRLYRVTALSRVPSAPTRALAAQDLLTEFTATAAKRTQAVSFLSSTPAYFICVAA